MMAQPLLSQPDMLLLTCRFTVIQGSAMKSRKVNVSRGIERSEVDNNISYQPLLSSPVGTESAFTRGVSGKSTDTDSQVIPISNLQFDDSVPDTDKGGVPSQRDFVRYRLERKVQALRASEKNLLGKLSRCLEVISDMERFIDVGLKYDQWETYGELQQRKARLRGVREMIMDVNADQQISNQEAKALKEKFNL